MARTHRIEIRVTEEEKEKINSNSNGKPSTWLRDFGLNNIRKKPQIKLQDPELIKEAQSIGHNLNQLTRNAHTKLNSGQFDSCDLVEMNILLSQIKESLTELVKKDVS